MRSLFFSAVACINVPQLFACDVGKAVDEPDARCLPVGHFKTREEPGDVQGYLRIHRRDPGCQLSDLPFGVVHPRDDQCRQLDVRSLVSSNDEVKDSLKIAAQDVFVGVGAESFEVDVEGVDVGRYFFQHTELRRSVGDDGVEHPCLVNELCGVADKFISDERLIVGESHAYVPAGAVILRQRGELCGGDLGAFAPEPLRLLRPGDLKVLTEGAAQIAAEAPHRKYHAAGMKTRERFFLDGVEG